MAKAIEFNKADILIQDALDGINRTHDALDVKTKILEECVPRGIDLLEYAGIQVRLTPLDGLYQFITMPEDAFVKSLTEPDKYGCIVFTFVGWANDVEYAVSVVPEQEGEQILYSYFLMRTKEDAEGNLVSEMFLPKSKKWEQKEMQEGGSGCNVCHGDEAIYWKDENNCAFVDRHGQMTVIADGKALNFHVDRCPVCGTELGEDEDTTETEQESNVTEMPVKTE